MSQPILCDSCGKLFPYATFEKGVECPACNEASRILEEDRRTPQCGGCGRLFVRLNPAVWCGACQAQSATPSTSSVQDPLLDAIQRGIENRPNPKAPQAGIRFNPVQHQTSGQVIGLMTMKRNLAQNRYLANGGPAPAAINGLGAHGGESSGSSVPCVFVQVLELRVNDIKGRNFSPYHMTVDGSMLYEDLLEKVRDHVDKWGLEQVPPKRFFNVKAVELRFLGSGLAPSTEQITWNTIYELFTAHNSANFRLPKELKKQELKLTFGAHVRLQEQTTFIHNPRLGRAGARNDFNTVVRTRVLPERRALAPGAALPPPPAKKAPFMFYKTTLEEEEADGTDGDNDEDAGREVGLKMVTTVAAAEYFVHDAIIGKGVTKKACKLEQVEDGQSSIYAAKWFYRGPEKEDVSPQKNIEYIKEELTRASNAIAIGVEFMADARKRNAAIHDVKFLKPFVLHEKPTLDEMDGLAYLCDVFIPGQMEKYSGTETPGNHDRDNHPGQTCDALAHYSLAATQQTSVLCDLQGIISTENGGPPVLNLFDVQMHTSTQVQGMGDMGMEGIRSFRRKHLCNDLCLSFGLPPHNQVINQAD